MSSSLIVSSQAKIENIPQGIYHAVCCHVIDLGTHLDLNWNKERRKISIGFEIPEVMRTFEKDGKQVSEPTVVSNMYTPGLAQKNQMRKDLVSWRGRDFTKEEEAQFDLRKLIGANCQIQIVHMPSKKDASKIYANIGSIVQAPKGVAKIEAKKPILFEIPLGEEKFKVPSTIPEWMRKKIFESIEFKRRGIADTDVPAYAEDGKVAEVIDSSDVPF